MGEKCGCSVTLGFQAPESCMVKKAGGKFSTKDLGVMGDLTLREAIVCVAELSALLGQQNEERLMIYVGVQPWVLHLGGQCLAQAQQHFPEA